VASPPVVSPPAQSPMAAVYAAKINGLAILAADQTERLKAAIAENGFLFIKKEAERLEAANAVLRSSPPTP